MGFAERHAIGLGVVAAALDAGLKGVEPLRTVLLELSDGRAALGLAMLAKVHANATRGKARLLPEEGIASLVVDAADEGGFFAAHRVADAFSDVEARAALGNLTVAVLEQSDRILRAEREAPFN